MRWKKPTSTASRSVGGAPNSASVPEPVEGKPVTIKYRPISFIPAYRTVSGSFPQNWGEVSAKQIIAIACLYKNCISDVAFLKRMTGIPAHVLKRTDDYERFKLMEQLEFISDRRAYHEFIIKTLPSTRFAAQGALRSLSLSKGAMLFAPEPKLKAVTFGQFIFADTYFSNYLESNDENDLNKFIAALYLRKYEKFDEQLIQKRHSAIGKIDRTTREAIVINYQLIREWLSLAYPLIFQKRNEMISDESSPEQRSVSKSDSSIWIKIFQNFVGDDILHDEEWASKPVNTIFAYMTRKNKENARRK